MSRRLRFSLVLVPLLLLVPGPSVAPASAPCAAPVEDPLMGRACPLDGGFLVEVSDGSWVLTHGGDPIPTTPRASAS